jgi:exodeoxyribonuclease VII large subunit
MLQGTLQNRLEKVRLILAQFAPDNLERNIKLLLQPSLQRLDEAQEGMSLGLKSMLTETRHRVELASREAESYSPVAVLQRGYAVVTHEKSHSVLLSPQGVTTGDGLDIRLAAGRMRATVEEAHADENL